MESDNLAAVLYNINDIRMEQAILPRVDKHDVLLRMAHVGICGSDVHYYTKGAIGRFVVKSPMILGHEGSGVVVECGELVSNLKVGDRVAIEPGIPCRVCKFCKSGRYNLCADVVFCATPPYDGHLCRFYKHPADFCFKLPDHVSTEEAAMLEPLSVAVHACQRASVRYGSVVLVCGAGPVGLVSLLCAKAMGATTVCITDIVDHRLALARTLGADVCLNVTSKDEQKIVQEVEEKLGEAPNITIECSGAESSIRLAILATAFGGTIVLVGLGQSEVRIPLESAALREVDIRGVFRYANCYPTALSLVASGKINLKPLITHRFKLEDAVTAFETVRTGTGNPIKVMIAC